MDIYALPEIVVKHLLLGVGGCEVYGGLGLLWAVLLGEFRKIRFFFDIFPLTLRSA